MKIIKEKEVLHPGMFEFFSSGAKYWGVQRGVPEGGTTEDAPLWWPSAIRSGRMGAKPHGRRK